MRREREVKCVYLSFAQTVVLIQQSVGVNSDLQQGLLNVKYMSNQSKQQ